MLSLRSWVNNVKLQGQLMHHAGRDEVTGEQDYHSLGTLVQPGTNTLIIIFNPHVLSERVPQESSRCF